MLIALIAAMGVAEKGFGTVRSPLHRPAQPPRRPQHQRFLRIMEDLGAEAAADVGDDHPDTVRRHLQRIAGELLA